MSHHILVIGASVAGTKFVQNLRTQGFDGAITLVDMEEDPLYDLPPLSKSFLSGAASDAEISLVSKEELVGLDVVPRFGVAAESLDTVAKAVTMTDGRVITYDTLVIATGARARRTPWADLPGVHVLRTRADAEGLRAELREDRRLAVIGAGFIGVEAAATAASAGMKVRVFEPASAPMQRAMNAEVGTIFAEKYQREGIELTFGDSVESVHSTDGGLMLRMSSGAEFDTDAVLLGIGAVVNTEWLDSSALTLENGVLCDSMMRAIGVSDVFAIGDVARFASAKHGSAVRLEHWTSAADQAKLVAHNILNAGDSRSYEAIEYVWSDQYNWKAQIVGVTGAIDWVLVGRPEDDRFAVVYGAADSPVEGVIIVNWPRALVNSRRSVAGGVQASELTAQLLGLLESPAKAA